MLLAYDSLTGNVRRLAQELAGSLDIEVVDVRSHPPSREYLLLTYTFGTGQVPDSTRNFLDQHGHLLRGVVSSGSYHWGQNFARAADVIAVRYGVPIVAKVNKGGTAADRACVLAWLREQNGYGTLD
ncbi:class Ib ribonucleoside-diphosphate reductase assembly flavoprotein NrdI [Deinococcus humi]|uniref:Protein involved in ribonucleotide reduction n=1 Tax=Deinococcus humi TaxID=662880 RepID=A0A7W8JV98_9DEIO|nr:class Ib ribonucleoside-diphosphate reductase assembly flavoprotein NrdI [Deinococcus humi]MBB5363890.1 protein involved in ribonucleotide reduction [Deinococcus humi]GGO31621.1 protein NrdI [Deinococcus humi]